MADLSGSTIASTYQSILALPLTGGDTTTLVALTDGDGVNTFALKVATTSISVGATNRIYLDGGGNTYLYESAADEVTLACGGELIRLGDATGTGENTIYGVGAGLTIDANCDANVFIGANVADASLSGADNNVGVGHNALSALTTGSNNVAIGKGAAILLTTANKTIFIGEEAGDAVTVTGGSNVHDGTVGIGHQALSALTSGEGNVAIGFKALLAEDDGDQNTAVGYQTLTVQTGTSGAVGNTAMGYQAGLAITDGMQNTIVGTQALMTDDRSDKTTAIGYQALKSQNGGTGNSGNTAVGYAAGYENETGINNTYIGYAAGLGASGQSNTANVGVGAEALIAVTDGGYNVAIGYQSGHSITTGDENIFIGQGAGSGTADVDKSIVIGSGAASGAMVAAADGTIAIGYTALQALTSGDKNIAIGFEAGKLITDGVRNIAIGHQALRDAAGTMDDNIAIGRGAMQNAENDACHNNIAIGSYTLDAIVDHAANNNTVIGHNAGTAITSATSCVLVGQSAGQSINTGIHNIAIGNACAASLTAGEHNTLIGGNNVAAGMGDVDQNVCIGSYAGSNDGPGGNQNTCVGTQAGYHLTSGANNIIIGYNAGAEGEPIAEVDTASNQIVLGNASITHAHVEVDWTIASDGRDKTDIEDFTAGLDFVNQMRPVTYRWDKRSLYVEDKFDENGIRVVTKEDILSAVPDGSKKKDKINLGFIAQEIQALEKQIGYAKVKDDGSADRDTELVADTTADGSFIGMKYPRLIPILVNAIQELSVKNDALEARVKALEDA